MENINFSEQLPDLLNGRLSAMEREKVEAAMLKNEALKKEYDEMLEMKEALEAVEYLGIKDMIKQEAEKSTGKVVPMKRAQKQPRRWMGIAASLLILVMAGSVWWMNKAPSNEGLISEDLVTFSFPTSVKRAAGAESISFYKEAANLHQKNNFRGAIQALDAVPVEDTLVYNRSVFLKGKVEMDDQQFPVAIDLFQQYLASGDEHYSDYAAFYLAQAYALNGEEEKAKAQLEFILKGRFTAKFKTGAKKLLGGLE